MEKNFFELPLIPLRGSVAFPDSDISFDLSRIISIEALERALKGNGKLFAVSQKDIAADEVEKDNLFDIGTVILIKNVIRLPGGMIRVLAHGIEKAKLTKLNRDGCLVACGEYIRDNGEIDETDDNALCSLLNNAFEKYCTLNQRFSPEIIMEIISAANTYFLVNTIGSRCPLKHIDKQKILEESDLKKKAEFLLEVLSRETKVLSVQREIGQKVKSKIDKTQREYFLREQAKLIQNELSGNNSDDNECDEYLAKLEKINMPDDCKNKLKKEIERLKKIPSSSSESIISRDYIELALSLPWDKRDDEEKDISLCEEILNKDHYALTGVKERIVEFLAVRSRTKSLNAPIICLVGPPGTGKTSIAKSVAGALNRKYIRISLGGVRDEAEIRGHRKTYVGAMPGRIISALKQCRTKNPLILLDEVDKISKDYKGDPSAALLEVLDGEQNFSFRDNYLELPFDLSDILFMCTANDISHVEPALKDRFDVIELSSYTDEEKFRIAKDFIIKKQLKRHGLKKSELKIKDAAVKEIITGYTKEAGVRGLERQIEKICRRAVKRLMTGDVKSVSVTKGNISDYLGKRKFSKSHSELKNEVGVVCGLAWTRVGGEILRVEVNTMKGSGKFSITGNIGKVMEESAKAAVSYIRANSQDLGIDEDFHGKTDIHIHIPEGAVPKDGPSAGVTLTTAMISALNGKAVKGDVAMTGEISLRGGVLPIGGLKEKVLAAKKAGIKTVIIPEKNSPELDELEEYVKDGLEFVLADKIDTVLKTALEN